MKYGLGHIFKKEMKHFWNFEKTKLNKTSNMRMELAKIYANAMRDYWEPALSDLNDHQRKDKELKKKTTEISNMSFIYWFPVTKVLPLFLCFISSRNSHHIFPQFEILHVRCLNIFIDACMLHIWFL